MYVHTTHGEIFSPSQQTTCSQTQTLVLYVLCRSSFSFGFFPVFDTFSCLQHQSFQLTLQITAGYQELECIFNISRADPRRILSTYVLTS